VTVGKGADGGTWLGRDENEALGVAWGRQQRNFQKTSVARRVNTDYAQWTLTSLSD